VSHNLARHGGLRRPLRIPNPISYVRLSEILVDAWTILRNHTWETRLSSTRPQVLRNSPRAITPRYRYAEVPRLRALRRRGSRYLLCTDINQFYPTIYTHSIPWALHTKAACKANLAARGNPLLGDSIDKAFASMNDGQTHGIPIGPDASLVAAETLLAAVDRELKARCAGVFQGFRYVDDYELAFSTLSDAEHVLVELQAILATFDLQLNPRKTEIHELPRALDESWAHDIGQLTIREAAEPIGQRNDIVALFSRAFGLAHGQPEKAVLRYAVSRLQGITVAPDGWRAFQNCLLGAVGADPATLPVVLGTLFRVGQASGQPVAKAPLSSVFESVISTHAPRAHGSEVAWALWGALAWNTPLDASIARAVSLMEDDIVALLSMDADDRQLFPPGSLDRGRWDGMVSQGRALEGEHWLLAYEGHRQGWLQTPTLELHPVFGPMADAGVNFLDRTQNSPQFPAAAGPIPGGTLDNFYA
jgi:Reverse transcriptase (RNA-dependent DNA polymerase)